MFVPRVQSGTLATDATLTRINPVARVVDTPFFASNNSVTFVGNTFVRLQSFDMDLPQGAADKTFEMSFATYAEYGLIFLKGNSSIFVAFEMFDAHLYFVYNLTLIGGPHGRINISASKELVSGVAQNLTLQIAPVLNNKSLGELVVHHNRKPIYGSPRIELDRRMLVGSFTYLGWVESLGRLPWALWSRVGLVGCVFGVKIDRTLVQYDAHLYANERQGGVMYDRCLTSDTCTGKCAPAAKGRCTLVLSTPPSYVGAALCDCALTNASATTCEGARAHHPQPRPQPHLNLTSTSLSARFLTRTSRYYCTVQFR